MTYHSIKGVCLPGIVHPGHEKSGCSSPINLSHEIYKVKLIAKKFLDNDLALSQ